jgi:hypothetical protein
MARRNLKSVPNLGCLVATFRFTQQTYPADRIAISCFTSLLHNVDARPDEARVNAMTVTELFERNGFRPHGPSQWGETIPCDLAGIYVVTPNPDPAWNAEIPVPVELPPELRERWLPSQPILYIGKAGGPGFKSTLRKRVKQFVQHRYGNPSPHSGGQDVKLLLPHQRLWVFWAPTQDPRAVERKMLAAFVEDAGRRPFANRQD